MIIWGGSEGTGIPNYFNTGGRYDPSTDSWTATSTSNAPESRGLHTAVWTGSEMIVWGGSDSISYFNTGGRYNPNTDSWTATSTKTRPVLVTVTQRYGPVTRLIVWGGDSFGGIEHRRKI